LMRFLEKSPFSNFSSVVWTGLQLAIFGVACDMFISTSRYRKVSELVQIKIKKKTKTTKNNRPRFLLYKVFLGNTFSSVKAFDL